MSEEFKDPRGVWSARKGAGIRGGQPAFPSQSSNPFISTPGMTLREHYAGLALQGLAVLPAREAVDSRGTAAEAVELADALLEALAEAPDER